MLYSLNFSSISKCKMTFLRNWVHIQCPNALLWTQNTANNLQMGRKYYYFARVFSIYTRVSNRALRNASNCMVTRISLSLKYAIIYPHQFTSTLTTYRKNSKALIKKWNNSLSIPSFLYFHEKNRQKSVENTLFIWRQLTPTFSAYFSLETGSLEYNRD